MRLAVGLASALGLACAPQAGSRRSDPPTEAELASATYAGIEIQNPVTLVDGRWEGAPYASGGSARPVVTLVAPFRIEGDLDGDGTEEVVVLLTASAGGSGTAVYLAVVGQQAGTVRNLATTLLGDRVQIRRGSILEGRLTLDMLVSGTTDPACCPGNLVSETWTLADGRLVSVGGSPVERLSLAALAADRWTLRDWDLGEPLERDIAISVAFDTTRIFGNAGCNTYSGSAGPGDLPGDFSFGPFAVTRMACPVALMESEARYLALLGAVTRVGFLDGRLALSYVKPDGAEIGVLLFEPEPREP